MQLCGSLSILWHCLSLGLECLFITIIAFFQCPIRGCSFHLGEENGNPLQYSCLKKSHGWRSLVDYSPYGLKASASLLTTLLHDLAISLSLFTFMNWKVKCHPSPVFLSEESQGLRSLVGCCLWGRTESDMTDSI